MKQSNDIKLTKTKPPDVDVINIPPATLLPRHKTKKTMKRPSSHQMTKDDADFDEELPAQGDGFQKASPDVLATRKIVKARRSFPASGPHVSTDAPKLPNPFASLALPTAPVATPTSAAQADIPQSSIATSVDATKAKPTPLHTEAPAVKKPTETEKETAEKLGNAEVVKPTSGSEPAEEQADVSKPSLLPPADVSAPAPKAQSPEDTTIPAEEMSATTKAQTSIQSPANGAAFQSAADGKPTPTDAPMKVVKAEKNDKPTETSNGGVVKKPFTFGSAAPALSFANAAAADNGSFNITPVPGPVASPAKPTLQQEFKKAHVETGEEQDRELFRARAKLYSLDVQDGKGRWRERGIGSLKLNKNVETSKVRILMRTEATLRVVLNTPIFREFKLDRATERSLRFQGYDVDDADGKNRMSFLIRFSTKDITSGLVEAIDKWKKDEDRK